MKCRISDSLNFELEEKKRASKGTVQVGESFYTLLQCLTPNDLLGILVKTLAPVQKESSPPPPFLTPSDMVLTDTPLGRRALQWIETINGNNAFGLENSKEEAEYLAQLRHRTGGLELRKVLTIAPSVECLLKGIEDPDPYILYQITVTNEGFSIKTINPFIEVLGTHLQRDFSGAVFVGEKENPLFTFATPSFSLETWVNIGAMSKMFTAVAIMQLVQSKKIKLEDKVKPLLDRYHSLPSGIETATIEDLLMNTFPGGKYAIKNFQHESPLNHPADYLRFYKNEDLLVSSEEFNDPHFNFILLGLVIEIVSKQDYYTYIKEKIYTPSKMVSSDSSPREPHLKHLPSKGSPAGGSYSTATDLFHFGLALMQGKLLDKEHTSLLVSFLHLKEGHFYGYGFEAALGEPRWIGRDVQGVSFRMYPDSSHVVVVLSPTAQRVADLVRKNLQIRED